MRPQSSLLLMPTIACWLNLLSPGADGVKIRELLVPGLVELGSEDIELDCDYDYDEKEKLQLEVKWYFDNEPTPFFQWLPGQMNKPQVIGEKFRKHLDLNHVAHTDAFKRHRALLLRRPTLELSGIYSCKVSTFIGEDIRQKMMVIYSPATFIGFQQERSPSGTQVNVSCAARGVFPMPRIKLTWGAYQLDDSDAFVTSPRESDGDGTFSVIVHRVVDHDDLPPETVFGCELSIPGTDYLVREESKYTHNGGRYSNPESRVASSSPPPPSSLTWAAAAFMTLAVAAAAAASS